MASAAPKPAKKTFCYMLHDPDTMAFAGKYNSVSHRYAALKAATKGVKDIRLRQTNTKTVHKYVGWTSTLEEPRMVKRGDRTIPYYKKPGATYSGSFEYTGKVEGEAAGAEAGAGDAPEAEAGGAPEAGGSPEAAGPPEAGGPPEAEAAPEQAPKRRRAPGEPDGRRKAVKN